LGGGSFQTKACAIGSTSAFFGCDRSVAPNQTEHTIQHCFHCGRQIGEADTSMSIMIVESHTGRLGSAKIHADCTGQALARYRQVVEWDGSTLGNLSAFKRLHGRIAAINKASWGNVSIVVA
jgi:hypothetical protein